MNSAALFRWNDYFMRGGREFAPFWRDLIAASERRLLFILGHGFDQRMCLGVETIVGAGGSGVRDAIVLDYDEGPRSHSQHYVDYRRQNGERLDALFEGRGSVTRRPLTMFSDDGRRVGARSITNEFPSMEEFWEYSDVVVDVSALPRGLYFPLLSKLLSLLLRSEPNGRVQGGSFILIGRIGTAEPS